MYHMNSTTLLESVAFSDEPSTEELRDDEEGEFIRQKRSRSRRFSHKSASSSQESPGKSVGPKSRHRVLANLFVDNIPLETPKDDLLDLFAKFGKISNMSICKRNPSNSEDVACNFAFITFDSATSVESALKQDAISGTYLRKQNAAVKLDVHRRKAPRREKRLSSSCSNSLSGVSLELGHNPKSEWYDILVKFDWKSVVAKYVLRDVTMEDHLREYVSSLAAFLGHKHEPLEDLKARLIFFSENCPSNIDMIMPPNISGLVYNQSQEKNFNLRGMLRVEDKLFRVEADRVFYLPSMSKEFAKRKLKECLLRGLFIYFFAKFSHDQTFVIKNSYYERSEPIRSALLVVTGINEVSVALRVFFNFFKDIFIFNKKKSGSKISDIKLTVNFYSQSSKEMLRSELRNPLEKETSQVLPGDFSDDQLFEMDTENIIHNLKGRITQLDRNSRIGFILFHDNGANNFAIFDKSDFFINGHPYSNILEKFVLGREVYLDVVEQPLEDVQFKAKSVWIGDKPDQNHSSTDKVTDLLQSQMSDLLDPVEDVDCEQMCRDHCSDGLSDLPASVQSVVQHVLESDCKRNLIINPEVVEQVLCGLKINSFNERNKIKRMLESKSRDFLINLIIDQIDELDFCSV